MKKFVGFCLERLINIRVVNNCLKFKYLKDYWATKLSVTFFTFPRIIKEQPSECYGKILHLNKTSSDMT